MKEFVQAQKLSVVKYEDDNEGKGTLIIAVNKKIGELFKQKKPPGQLEAVMSGLFSGFEFDVPALRDLDAESQRAGLEIYLWPIDDGVLMELFVLPYMEHLDHTEIFGLTETKDEEIADWYLCEHIWADIEPKIVREFNAEPVHRRA
jgi:hypothetical protein